MRNVVFIGIGGIGMSALAQYYLSLGKQVVGYDKTPSLITAMLADKGAKIGFEFDTELLKELDLNSDNTLLIYTPAVSREHPWFKYFENLNILALKRAQVLGEISRETRCLAVAGTHGKTTTSAILAHIMTVAQTGAYGFLGGIASNYESNYIAGSTAVSIVEADEFDRSFLSLNPEIACITTTDADHLDIYGSKDQVQLSFEEFAQKVTGALVYRKGLDFKGYSYGLEGEGADYELRNIKILDGAYHFDVKTPKSYWEAFEFKLPGNHNLLNALAAVAMADQYGVNSEDIKKSLKSFKGVDRRFSIRHQSEDLVLIDDYAHHPTEVLALLEGLKQFYPEDELTAVFQPHLFSRTRDFMDEFAQALASFDHLALLPIYPARELPIDGVSSEVLKSKIKSEDVVIIQKEDFESFIEGHRKRVVVCFGAGDIGLMIKKYADEKAI
ncbi:MAG: UDP-N-acetylmuramate--L-alanine ligase [Flavobacteriaceae bacterium]